MFSNRVAACDVTGGVASLNFDATELRIFKGNLGSLGYGVATSFLYRYRAAARGVA